MKLEPSAAAPAPSAAAPANSPRRLSSVNLCASSIRFFLSLNSMAFVSLSLVLCSEALFRSSPNSSSRPFEEAAYQAGEFEWAFKSKHMRCPRQHDQAGAQDRVVMLSIVAGGAETSSAPAINRAGARMSPSSGVR